MDKKWKQYTVLIVGLLLGGGFAFGGMLSYAGLTPSGGNNQQQQDRPELPAQNVNNETFGLSYREQGALAYQNNAVFVTGVYKTEEDLQQLQSLSDLPQRFNNQVYVQFVNQSLAPPIPQYLGIIDTPQVAIIGGQLVTQQGRQGFYSTTLESFSQQEVDAAVCNGFRSLEGNLTALCV